MKKYWKATLLVSLCCILIASLICLVGCKNEPEAEKPTDGKIQGVVLDENGDPLAGATIFYLVGDSEEDNAVESDDDGNFEIRSVTIGKVTLTASLNGYAEATKSLTEADFNKEGVAKPQIVMEEGKGTIKGVVTMSGHSDIKLSGVTVKIGTAFTATTNAKGEYEIANVPMLDRKSITVSFDGYETTSKSVTKNQYSNGVAKVNFELVQNDLAALPGLKPYALEKAPIDPSVTLIKSGSISDYFELSTDGVQGSSKTESHGEGFCLNADTMEIRDNMVAFIATKLKVDTNHKFVTVYARIFKGQNGFEMSDADKKDPTKPDLGKMAQLGLFAFDAEGNFINDSRFGEFTEITTESFMPVTFDLSKKDGETITIVLGTKTGYHCCIDRIEFSASKPANLTVSGVDGINNIRLYDKVTETTFDAEGIKSNWHTGGAVGTVSEGYQLNGTDPWKAEEYNPANPQPVNAYMYMTTDLTENNSTLNLTATIVKLADIQDGAQDNKSFYPYICVILIDKDGNKLTQTDWTKVDVSENNEEFPLSYDFSDYIGEDVTVVIAANVGYRATITNVSLTSASQN